MLVDELVSVDHLRLDLTLLQNFTTFGFEGGLDKCLDILGDGVRLDETEGGVFDGEAELAELFDAFVGVERLNGIEERALLAIRERHLRIHHAVHNPFLRATVAQHCLGERVLGDRDLEPVAALRHRLKRRCRGVNSVVPRVRHLLQAELLPVRHHNPTERVRRGLRRVGRSENLVTEILPRKRSGLPLDDVVVDREARGGELGAHRHEEAIEDVDRVLALHLNQTAVEAAAELDELLGLLADAPLGVHLVGGDAQFGAAIQGVEDIAVGQGFGPLKAELGLELVRRDVELVRGKDGRLAREKKDQ